MNPVRTAFLKRLEHTRAELHRKVADFAELDESEFWLNALVAIKLEQSGFSDVYFQPKGQSELSESDRINVFHPYLGRFTRPEGRTEWSRFYFNHLQALVITAAAQLKQHWVQARSAHTGEAARLAFDAVIFPMQLEAYSIREDGVVYVADQVTAEALSDANTLRRMALPDLIKPKSCCKSEPGCTYCPHNRRHLQPKK